MDDALWQVVTNCWDQSPENRPNASTVVQQVSVLVYHDGGATSEQLSHFPVCPTHPRNVFHYQAGKVPQLKLTLLCFRTNPPFFVKCLPFSPGQHHYPQTLGTTSSRAQMPRPPFLVAYEWCHLNGPNILTNGTTLTCPPEKRRRKSGSCAPSYAAPNLSVRVDIRCVCNRVFGLSGSGKTTVELYTVLRVSFL